MKKIVFILPDLIAGGAQRVVLNLCKILTNNGFQVDLLTISSLGNYFDKVPKGVNLIVLNERIRTPNLKITQVLIASWNFIKYLRKNNPDIIISSLSGTNLFSIICKLVGKINIPLVITEHSVLHNIQPVLLTKLVKILYRKADKIICVSSGIKIDLESLGLPSENIVVINNPIDVDDIKKKSMEDPAHHWLMDKSLIKIIAVGRLIEAKGFDKLINAFSKVIEQIPAKLIILGDGPLKSTLSDLCHELGVENNVDLVGHVDNPYSYIAKSDLFVLSSNWEGFVTVLLEAMTLGVPVVANDCWTSPKEILNNGTIGVLTPNNNPETLASCIIKALDEPQDTQLLIDRATDFSTSSITEKYIEQLNELIH